MKILGTIRQSVAHGALGGMELVTHDLYRGLVEKGFEVLVLTTALKDSDEQEKIVDGVKYIFIQESISGMYSNEYHRGVKVFFDKMAIDANLPDIIHSASGAAASLLQNKEGVPVVATWHGTRLEEELDKLSDYAYIKKGKLLSFHFERLYLNGITKLVQQNEFGKFDAHVAISPFMKQCITSYGVHEAQTHVIRNSLPKYFSRQISKKNVVGNRIVLGLVGRLIPMKGHMFFAEVAKQLDPNKYQLLLIGAGESQDVYQNCGLEVSSVRVDRDKIPDMYRMMDIFVNPTFRYSGFDLTVQEALASGVVTLVSDVTPYHEYFIELNERYGNQSPYYEFKVADIESCLNAINRIVVNKATNEHSDDFQKEFSFELMIDKYIAVFQKLKKEHQADG